MRTPSWGMVAIITIVGPAIAYLVVAHPDAATGLAVAGLALAAVPFLAPLRFKIEQLPSSPPAVELLALPLLIEGQVFLGANLTAAALIALAIYLSPLDRIRPTLPWPIVVGVAVTFALPFARPFGGGSTWQSLLIPGLVITVLAMSVRRREAHAFISSIIDGVGLYLIANVVAYYAGIVSPAAGVRTGALEASGGGLRIIFPFTSSLALPPAMAAMFVAAALICLERCGARRRLFRLAAVGAAVFILIAADTRAALAAAVLVLLLAAFSTRLLARLAVPMTVVALAFVFVFTLIKDAISPLLTGAFALAPGLSRGDTAADVLTLSFRSVIWENSIRFWSGSVVSPERFIGFGTRGQQRSGASASYGDAFTSISADPRGASVHNSYLQHLYDAGLAGAAVLFALLLYGTWMLAQQMRAGTPGTQYALPAMLAAIVAGVTEVTLAPGYGQAPAYIAMGLVMCVSGGHHGHAEARSTIIGARLPSTSEPEGHVAGSAPLMPETA